MLNRGHEWGKNLQVEGKRATFFDALLNMIAICI
jgi:hypothetical protein